MSDGNCDFEIGLPGEIAVLGFVEGALEIIDFRSDVNAAAQCAIVVFAFERGEFGKPGQREIDLGDRARHAIVLQLHDEIGRKMRRINQFQQRTFGIRVRDHRSGGNFFAIREHDPAGDAVFDAYFDDFGTVANLGTGLLGGGSHGLRDRAHASAGEPGSTRRVFVAGGADEQHQAAARGPGAQECPEDSTRGDGGAQQFGLEIFRYQISHRHRPPAQQAVHVAAGPVCGGRGRY